MDALIIIGGVVVLGCLIYNWICHEYRMGQAERGIKSNSEIIMREINDNK